MGVSPPSVLSMQQKVECYDRQAMLKRLALLEACVEAALKVSMAYSLPVLWAKPEYYRCLIAVMEFSLRHCKRESPEDHAW